MNTNTLQALWQSTEDLHTRFFTDNPPEFSARWRKMFEEISEFTDEVSMPTEFGCDKATKEAADVVVTIIGLLQARDCVFEQFEIACQHVVSKNDSKSLDSHFVNEKGLIARKEVVKS